MTKIIAFVSLVAIVTTLYPQQTTDNRQKNFAFINPTDTPEQIIVKAANVVPTKQQYDWQKLEFIAFAHFGMNTFTNNEWGAGKEDEKLFNPTNLDARQ